MLVKFYCDVSLSKLQLTPSSVNFVPFYQTKEEQGRPMMVKRKLNDTVVESSADQEIRKSDVIVHNL